jgi:cbb3-type cytochrome oxidase maturation protein
MEVIIILIAISMVLALAFLGFFILAVKRGQFEDEYTPAMRMLFDPEVKSEKTGERTPEKAPKKEEKN